MKTLKPAYTAPSKTTTKDKFAEWSQRYPTIIQFWESSWTQYRAAPRLRRLRSTK